MPRGIYKRKPGTGVGSFGKYKRTPETIEKMRKSHLGKPGYWTGKKGRFCSPETRLKMSLSRRGQRNGSWKGGITPLNVKIRTSIESDVWRNSVFARDGYTCQKYGTKGDIQAHHILNFSGYPELRFAIDNGITLSVKAHKEFHKKYGKTGNNLKQLNEFLYGK